MAKNNPLKLIELSPYGLPILPQQNCSEIRQQYFTRINRILGSYTTLSAFSNIGFEKFSATNQLNAEIKPNTPFRIIRGEVIIQSTPEEFNKMYHEGAKQLPSQYFLMVYGNFESFVSDIVQKAFKENGSDNPINDTKSLLITSSWQSKLQKIINTFELNLREKLINQKYQNHTINLLGKEHNNPILYLTDIGELRNYLVHSSARIDEVLSTKYPDFNNRTGEIIPIPFEFPFNFSFFLVLMTDILDHSFSEKFGWERKLITTQKLID